MRSASLLCAPLANGLELAAQHWLAASPALATAPTGERVKGFAFQFERNPMRIHSPAPTAGQHNPEFFGP